MTDLEIKQTRFGAPDAQGLIAAAQADLEARYGEPDQSRVEAIEFDPPEGAFLVAYVNGEPVACAGWRTLSHFLDIDGAPTQAAATEAAAVDRAVVADDVAEIKRMYVAPAARGTGVAALLLAALEESARDHGMCRMVLETGLAQPEAIRFYVKSGYRQITSYGHYKDAPNSVSYGRDL